MIPNITHSTGSGNYLGYNLGDKKEQYQKVQFLAAEGVMIDDRLIDRLNQNWDDRDEESYREFRKVAVEIANDLDNQFRAQAALNGRPTIKAINISLSYSPADTDKVNEMVYDETRGDYVPLRLKMGRKFLDGMGFGECQYVAVSHLGTHCAHDHYAINTVRADGTTINLKYDFVRAQKVAAEIRKEYGLALPDESLQMIAPKAKEALRRSCSWEEYEEELKKHGILLVFSDHSKNGRGYGVSYSFRKKVIPGSKLHRSLSYGQVNSTLMRNLAARQSRLAEVKTMAQIEAEEARAKEEAKAKMLKDAYIKMIPTMKGLQAAVEKAFELYESTKMAADIISAQTDSKYTALSNTWEEFNKQKKKTEIAKTAKDLSIAIGGMLVFLNPIAGLLVMVVGSIAADIRMSNLNVEKKVLLKWIDEIRSDIDNLETQKAQIAMEKKEHLEDYLQAKDSRDSFRKSLEEFDQAVHDCRIDILKQEYPFRDNAHMQYIIHSRSDASLFRAEEGDGEYRKVPTGEYRTLYNGEKNEIKEDYYEKAREALKDKVMFVASDRGPNDFYETLLEEQNKGNYRVGDIQIHPDGKISFGQERVFGNPKMTEHAVPKIEDPVVQKHAPTIEKAAQEASEERRRAAERLSKQPETFVIHGEMGATLYSNSPGSMKTNMLHEAARSILKYYTWGADVRYDEPKEFVEAAVNGQQFGTIKYDMGKARFIGEGSAEGMLVNPEDVIQFADHNGQAQDLFTPEFWSNWQLRLVLVTNSLQEKERLAKQSKSAEQTPEPLKKQKEAHKPEEKPVPEVTPVAQQQTALTPKPTAKPTYEVVQKFNINGYTYRIKKEHDGMMKLQMLDWDKRSPVVNGKHTGKCWYNMAFFTSYKEIGRDADGVYLKIVDVAGKTRFIDQSGSKLNVEKKRQFGIDPPISGGVLR